MWRDVDVLVTPTAGRCYTIADVLAEPIKLNSNLGYYTNFMNLLDLSAIAVPAGHAARRAAVRRDAGGAGVPGSLAAVARARSFIARSGRRWARSACRCPPAEADGATSDPPGAVSVAVFGAHMSGLPLNHELTDLGGRFVRKDRTAPRYRLFALPDVTPASPGWCGPTPGRAIDLEIWRLPVKSFGTFVAGIPGPLSIGKVELSRRRAGRGVPVREITPPTAPRIFPSWEAGAAILKRRAAADRRQKGERQWQRYKRSLTSSSSTPRPVALVIIDMQRDFVDPGGFGEALGNDVSLLRRAIAPTQKVLAAARAARHAGDPYPRGPSARPLRPVRRRKKRAAGSRPASAIPGRWAASWCAASTATTSSTSLKPIAGEPVIDKPGKGAFYATDLDAMLKSRDIRQLIVCGVTTEVCVNTTVREANDRGYDCLVLEDCVASYFPEFQRVGDRDDQGPGRHFRLGRQIGATTAGTGIAGQAIAARRHRTRTNKPTI